MATPIFKSFLTPTVCPEILEMVLKTLFNLITINRENCIEWLRVNGLLARGMVCKCGNDMREGMFHSIADGRGWRCPNKECKKFTSLRSGTFFEGSNLALTDLVEFIYF